MTVLPAAAEHDLLPRLVLASPQADEWAEALDELPARSRQLAVAHTPDRGGEATRIGRHFSAVVEPLERVESLLERLRRDDLLILVTTSGARSLQSVAALPSLHRLLNQGVMIWGITGPRPNPLSPYCHDILPVPSRDPALLLRCHRLIVRRFTRSLPPDPSARERRSRSAM